MSEDRTELVAEVSRVLRELELDATPLCVAFSGGLDSTVLLYLLAQLRGQSGLRAVHVDHGLHADSAIWAEHCASQCARLGVPLTTEQVSIARPSPHGVEAAARMARYDALRAASHAGEALLTAHHSRDQLETVLLALLRGSGVLGLAAMPPEIRRHGLRIVRPLLRATPAQLRACAEAASLEWLEDPANGDLAFDRNYLRTRVVPSLEQRWPGAAAAAVRSARWCGEANGLLNELAAIDLGDALEGNSLPVATLELLPPSRRRNLVRHIAERLNFPAPGAAQLDQVMAALLSGPGERASAGHWPGVVVRRYRDRLWWYAAADDPAASAADTELPWHAGTTIELSAGLGALEWQDAPDGLRPELANATLWVRWRSGGERLRPRRKGASRPLKKLLQEAGIPPWMRGQVPLIYAEDQLIAVGDLWLNMDHAVSRGEQGIRPVWHRRPAFH